MLYNGWAGGRVDSGVRCDQLVRTHQASRLTHIPTHSLQMDDFFTYPVYMLQFTSIFIFLVFLNYAGAVIAHGVLGGEVGWVGGAKGGARHSPVVGWWLGMT